MLSTERLPLVFLSGCCALTLAFANNIVIGNKMNTTDKKSDIGLIGLAVMGENLVLNMVCYSSLYRQSTCIRRTLSKYHSV